MRTDARTRAGRCFALARSTTFPAERDTAIETGIRIAKAAGLNLDSFDIPGRTRAVAQPRGHRASDRYSAAEIRDVMRRFRAHMAAAERRRAAEDDVATALERLRATLARQAAATGAAPDETIHDARIRNFHHAAAEARARDARREAA